MNVVTIVITIGSVEYVVIITDLRSVLLGKGGNTNSGCCLRSYSKEIRDGIGARIEFFQYVSTECCTYSFVQVCKL